MQILTTVFLLLASGVGLAVVRGDVLVIANNYNLDPFPDIPADFGPVVPDEGVEGLVRLADPEDACQPLTFQDYDTPWVALISRQQQSRSAECTFDVKVRNAQDAGAVAAIVYDDIYESLIVMSKPYGNPDPEIPAVFVSQKAGYIIKKLMTLDSIHVRITPTVTVPWLSVVISALLGLVSLLSVIAAFHVLRTWLSWMRRLLLGEPTPPVTQRPGQTSDYGLSPSALRSLPVVIYDKHGARSSLPTTPLKSAAPSPELGEVDDGRSKSSGSSECEVPLPGVHAGETKRVCAICLEHYEDGEKIRVLPCHHRFHMSCVDQWLSNRRACPVCKHDASQPVLPMPPPWTPASQEGGLLGQLSRHLHQLAQRWREPAALTEPLLQPQQPDLEVAAGAADDALRSSRVPDPSAAVSDTRPARPSPGVDAAIDWHEDGSGSAADSPLSPPAAIALGTSGAAAEEGSRSDSMASAVPVNMAAVEVATAHPIDIPQASSSGRPSAHADAQQQADEANLNTTGEIQVVIEQPAEVATGQMGAVWQARRNGRGRQPTPEIPSTV